MAAQYPKRRCKSPSWAYKHKKCAHKHESMHIAHARSAVSAHCPRKVCNPCTLLAQCVQSLRVARARSAISAHVYLVPTHTWKRRLGSRSLASLRADWACLAWRSASSFSRTCTATSRGHSRELGIKQTHLLWSHLLASAQGPPFSSPTHAHTRAHTHRHPYTCLCTR